MTDLARYPHQQFSDQRIVIMSAPNGARRMPDGHSSLPVTSEQIGECAATLQGQSVAVLHMHVRDSNHAHTLDADRYRAATSAVRSTVGDKMIIQITTEAVGRYHRDEQMAVVRDLRPEAVSLALRELCPDESTEVNAAMFFAWLVRENIWPQYILYSVEDVLRFERLRRKGFFGDDHPFCMLVLGEYANDRDGDVNDMIDMLSAANFDGIPWSVCCFGKNENAAARHADVSGGHVRLGFENNILLVDGSEADSNAALIAEFHATRSNSNRQPATADEIREQWLAA